MAEILRYVDTGSAAAGDGESPNTSDQGDGHWAYQSLNQWEAAEETTLDGDSHIVHCNRTNSGGEDTISTTISGWTQADSDDHITVIADDFPDDGIYDNTKYLFSITNQAAALAIGEDYVRIVNFQMLVTTDGTASRHGIQIAGVGVASDIIIDSCIVKGSCSGASFTSGFNFADGDATVTVFNTIVTGFVGSSLFHAFIIQAGTAIKFYNCTAYGNYYGFRRTAGTVSTINCLSFNNTNDFDGAVNADYCASDDGDGNNEVDVTAQDADDWAALVKDAAGDDFRVTDTDSLLYQRGNGATPKSLFTDDIIGTERDAVDLNWDIGAYELVGAPVGNAAIMTTNAGFWGPTF